MLLSNLSTVNEVLCTLGASRDKQVNKPSLKVRLAFVSLIVRSTVDKASSVIEVFGTESGDG